MQAAAVLLDAGADMNTRNHKRNITPVMIAGAVGHFSLLKLMASHPSADVNVQVYTHTVVTTSITICVVMRHRCK